METTTAPLPTAPAVADPAGDERAPPAERVADLEASIGRVIRGKPAVVRLAVVSLLAQGHVLIEDVPGVGKTTLAQALARSVGLAFQRVQFTSDMLPSDILGVSIYNQKDQGFEFVPGPVFANVVLADEINRATPKTQSALLEAMSERQVSVDRKRFRLPEPFVVLATQNPLEYHGTFPLPESQLDRFLISLEVGYPPEEEERALLLSGGVEEILADLSPVLSKDEVTELQRAARRVRVADKLAGYVLALVSATRESHDFLLGVSTRGAQALFRATQALAVCEGRDYAVPDDVQSLAVPVLAHRVILRRSAGDLPAAREAIRKVVDSVPVPV